MTRKEKGFVLLLLLILTVLWLVLRPGCPWRRFTGIPCPGCGMSRAWLAALGLDFAGALAYHPMFWAVPVFLWLFWRDFRPFRRGWMNGALLLLLAAGLLGCWGYRLYMHLII